MKMVALVRYVTVRARRRHESQDKWVQFEAPGPRDVENNERCPDMATCRPIIERALGDRVSVMNLRQHQGMSDDGLEELDTVKFAYPNVDDLADVMAEKIIERGIYDRAAEVAGEPKRRGRPPKQRVLSDEELAQ